jgi:NTE family protein
VTHPTGASASTATAHGVDEYLPGTGRHGIGLCLSGGGFRAALFHLGVLRRMNELGLLAGLRSVTSVSGGSLVAARLALGLPWPLTGPAEAFDEQVADPVRAFTRRNLRTPAILRRLLPWNWLRTSTGVETLAARLQRDLGRHVLSQLPARPDFLICATDMAYGVSWIFTRDRMGDYQAGYADVPPTDWPIARAVAASACFPPVFNPLPVRLRPNELVDGAAPAGPARDAVVAGIRLTDGGVYDNLGLEPVWRTHAAVLVSDAGALFNAEADRNLLWRIRRYTAIPENQAGALRKRWLISNFLAGVMDGAYWGISSATSSYAKGDAADTSQGYSKVFAAEVIARIRTDMDAFSRAEAAVLENHGYLVADAALRRHVASLLPDPVPPAVPPHPAWLDEARAGAALRDSHRRTILGRL